MQDKEHHKIHEIYIKTENQYLKDLEKDSKKVLLGYSFLLTFFFECVIVGIILLVTEKNYREAWLLSLLYYYIPCKIVWMIYHYFIDMKVHTFDKIEESIFTGVDLTMILLGIVAFVCWIVFSAKYQTELSYQLTFVFGFQPFIHFIPFVVIKLVMSLCYISNNEGQGEIAETLFSSYISKRIELYTIYQATNNFGQKEILKVSVYIYRYRKQNVSIEDLKNELKLYFKVSPEFIMFFKQTEQQKKSNQIKYAFISPQMRIMYAINAFQNLKQYRKDKAMELFMMGQEMYKIYYEKQFINDTEQIEIKV